MSKPIIHLAADQTMVSMSEAEIKTAIEAAYWSTCSPNEHVWTQDQQYAMAMFCLWSHQRLSAVEQVVGMELSHPPLEKNE